jgi:hypothetical protein
MAAPDPFDFEAWDTLQREVSVTLYKKACRDVDTISPLAGMSIQELSKALPKRDTTKIKKRLQVLHNMGLLQIREDTGQKCYALDLFQFSHYAYRADIQAVLAFFETSDTEETTTLEGRFNERSDSF